MGLGFMGVKVDFSSPGFSRQEAFLYKFEAFLYKFLTLQSSNGVF